MRKFKIVVLFYFFAFDSLAQNPRLNLFEEFTGETCPPCAATNPGLNAFLSQPSVQSKVIAIKWQVPIPSAPSNTWSLYQTNKTEIDWRRGPAGPGYGYSVKSTSTSPATNGVNSAPTGLIDGQELWRFGASNTHAGSLKNSVIDSAQKAISPFAITMNRAWNPTYTAVTLTVNIQATSPYNANGNLVFRLVMIERHIHFATQPGTNGEKDFDDVARQSFPTLQTGTPMAPTWTVGQSQTFTINCPIPASILNIAEVAFVGFVQNDATKKVEQAALAEAVGQNNDAKAVSVFIPDVICSNTINPVITIKNHGDNAITSLSISPFVDGNSLPLFAWNGTLSAGAITTLALNTYSVNAGTHTFSYNISNVNGAADSYTVNNSFSYLFLNAPVNFTTPISESFSLAAFPPSNWAVINLDKGVYSWSRIASVGAYGKNNGAIKYDFYNNGYAGDEDDLYLPPIDITGISSPSLTFDMAYAEYPGNYVDAFKIQVSNNCGASWATVYNKTAPSLSTALATTSDFIPLANEWRREVVSLSSFTSTPNLLLRFKAINANGNNLWIDNINLGTMVLDETSIKEQIVHSHFNVGVFPNPAKETAQLNVNCAKPITATISVINLLGEIVYSDKNNFTEGLNHFDLDFKNLANGVYYVAVKSENSEQIEKIVVNK